jgi:hypothetical protein
MNWNKEDIEIFMLKVAPPGHIFTVFDDHVTYESALKFATDTKNHTLEVALKQRFENE